MTIDELKHKTNAAMFLAGVHGLEVFACVQGSDGIEMKKFQINDELRDSITNILDTVIRDKVLCDDALLDSADNIDDNRKVLYEIPLTDSYNPFSCISGFKSITEVYDELAQEFLMGFLFRIHTNDNAVIWAYQNVYQQRLIKRSKSVFAMFAGRTYVPLDRDILKIESKIDFLLVDSSLIALNIGLLERNFGFEKYIRAEAQKTVQAILTMDILSSTEKFAALENKLSNAKKLMKAKHSPVLEMNPAALIQKLSKHPRYKDKFSFAGNKIVVKSQKDALEFIKMLNDNIVRSDLTNQEYDSSIKERLAPISGT